MIPPREVELKLELDPVARPSGGRARRALRRLSGLGQAGETRRLVSAIYDTHDHALRRRGLVLRIRRDGERRIQTLKADLGAGALERAEWECEVADDRPDLAAIADPELRREVEAAGPLEPVLKTEFDRTSWRLRRNGSDVELALDEGTIRAGERSAPIGEIEIELKSGAPTALFSVAREIVGVVAARPGMRSKSERGYDLLSRTAAAKAEPFRVDREMNVAATFRVIARSCLEQYRLHEPGILVRDAEALHKARVAIRRLRSCFKLHKALVADEEGQRLKEGLRRFCRDLGVARNLDVYLARIEGGEAPADLLPTIAAERELAYDRLLAKLRSKSVRVLLLDVLAYAETGGWLRDPARRKLRETPIRAFAAKTLAKRWRRLNEAGRGLAAQSAEMRHDLRIDGKVLRYATEFFAGAFAGRKRKRRREGLLDALAELQLHLGDLNDIEVGVTVVAGMSAPPPPAPDPGRIAALIAAAQEAQERIARAEPFWA